MAMSAVFVSCCNKAMSLPAMKNSYLSPRRVRKAVLPRYVHDFSRRADMLSSGAGGAMMQKHNHLESRLSSNAIWPLIADHSVQAIMGISIYSASRWRPMGDHSLSILGVIHTTNRSRNPVRSTGGRVFAV